MKNDRAAALLADIAKLLNKHGPDAFQALGELLASPEFSKVLSAVLLETAAGSREARATSKKPRSLRATHSEVRRGQADIQKDDPEKAHLLGQIRERLLDPRVLPKSRDLRTFAEEIGVRLNPSEGRRQMVESLLRKSHDLSTTALEKALAHLEAPSQPSGLQGWSEIILPGKQDARDTARLLSSKQEVDAQNTTQPEVAADGARRRR